MLPCHWAVASVPLFLVVSGFPVLPLVLSWFPHVAGLMVDQSSVLVSFHFNKCRNKFIIIANPLKTRLRTCLPCRSYSLATLLASANSHLKRKYLKNPRWKVNERVVWERAWLEPAADKLEQVWKISAKTWNSVSLVQTGILFLRILWLRKPAARVFQNSVSWFLFLSAETDGNYRKHCFPLGRQLLGAYLIKRSEDAKLWGLLKCYSSLWVKFWLEIPRALPKKHLDRVSEGKHVLLCVDFIQEWSVHNRKGSFSMKRCYCFTWYCSNVL